LARKKQSDEIIELKKTTNTSIIAVQRHNTLEYVELEPKTLDELYATIPEISRAIDLRGAAIISRGFEVSPRDESEQAKRFASICLKILNDSGGTSFFEQWQKNTDLYGNGYVELVEDEGNKITKLVHVHAHMFGYELEEYNDKGTVKTRIKLDPDTQEPVGYATYKYDELKGINVNDKKIEKEKIAHLRYKLVGDALYGVSIVQPMYGSIVRKLRLEQAIEDAGRLVSSPKIVITGEFSDDEEARREAKEAASLDVSDVVILQNGKEFEIVNPGETSLPQLREIFITNITAATGIPRPILTSEGNDINKATISELIKHLRSDMRSNMNKIKEIVENHIFARIGETYNIPNWQTIIPVFEFPEDTVTEDEIIVREERKAATLTSLSNSLSILNSVYLSTGSNIEGMKELMEATIETYKKTINAFTVNNDQKLGLIEEDIVDTKELMLNADVGYYNNYSMVDEIDTIKQPDVLINQHYLIHQAFEQLKKGSIIRDPKTNKEISMMQLLEKHRFYLNLMKELGIEHPLIEAGKELDDIYYKLME